MQNHQKKNQRLCYLLEMVWTNNNIFESGRKFCPTLTTAPPSCKVDSIAKKSLAFPLTTQTPTWNACRDLCNEDENCEYFKWKVEITL